MKILFYTVSSKYYNGITGMMLDSFHKNVHDNNTDFVVLYNNILDDKNIKHDHKFAKYIYCGDIVTKTLARCKRSIRGVFNSRSAYWLKSQICNIYKDSIDDYDVIAYVDSDTLFFSDIKPTISDCLSNLPDTFFVSADHRRGIVDNNNKTNNISRMNVNSGFWFCDIQQYPIKNLLQHWGSQVTTLYTNPKSQTNKLYRKYPDQTILRHILANDQNFNRYNILCPAKIATKFKYPESLMCHYFMSHLRGMREDYKVYIQNS